MHGFILDVIILPCLYDAVKTFQNMIKIKLRLSGYIQIFETNFVCCVAQKVFISATDNCYNNIFGGSLN